MKICFAFISDYLAEAFFFSVLLSGVVVTFVIQSSVFPDIVSLSGTTVGTIDRNRQGYVWLVNIKELFHNFLRDLAMDVAY